MAAPPQRPVARPSSTGSGSAAGAASVRAVMSSSGTFTSDQLSPDATAFPPLYEASILYAADCYDAAEQVLKEHLKSKEGKDSLRIWLMLFDFYQLTNNRKEFDALSMLFTVKFERSPPIWSSASDAPDPRRKEKRERKDFFPINPSGDGTLLGEIDRFEAFAKEMGTCRLGFEKVKSIHSEEAELLSLVLARLRRSKIPLWFNGFNDFTALLRARINDLDGQPAGASQGFWSLLFELFILDGRLQEYEDLGLEYAVAFEMSPPPWEAVTRPGGSSPEGGKAAPGEAAASAEAGFPMRGVISANNKDQLKQLTIHAASRQQEVLVDMSGLLRVDFAMASEFFETVRAIHLSQKRVILSNLNELVAALLEVFGMTKHAILMRRKSA